MTSKRSRWQARWQTDPSTGLATHETGLRVKIEQGVGVAENADEVASSLAAAHGEHNARAMVTRLTREGAQLLVDPTARGWRRSEGRSDA